MEKINNIVKHKYFNDLYCLVLALIALLTWQVHNVTGFIIFSIVGSASLIFLKDLKYLVPIVIYFPFISQASFMDKSSYIGLIICGAIFLGSIVTYLIINKMKIKFDKNSLPLMLMSVSILLPILWLNSDFKGYAGIPLYFCGFLYLVLYLIFRSSKTQLLDMVVSTHLFFSVILTGQLTIWTLRHIEYFDAMPAAQLGWGISNEAAILLCSSMSFIFYKLIKSEKKIVPIIMIIVNVIGLVLSFSRAGYLFGAILLGLLILYIIFRMKNKKYKLITLGTLFVAGIVGLVLVVQTDLINQVFESGLESNGRLNLYERAFNLFIKNPLNFIFGSGFISEVNIYDRLTVWHSTLFQTIACGGIVLLGLLIWHFYKKYIPLLKNRSVFAITTIIGFLVVDLYGMIDNTYYMYYYMIPLVIILASLDNDLDDYTLLKEDE